ncbi:MAG: hypothetical protein QJT81_01815 [Candidatus Thiothrix putei]|uniref:Uncharacterized protein n=1 Tax=Candidatus Thiothrix putei TaxID=3080811 RepID=A0AA95KN10_9GAMM|nr:MAG: hypothetical protein QJT81_01815 [Candidatus Thiothrix putei]
MAEVVMNPVITLLRPDDLLNVRIECRNLQLDKRDRADPVLVATDAGQVAYLIVHFPPQSLAEEAVYEANNSLENDAKRQATETEEERKRREAGGQNVGSWLGERRPAKARLSQPSRLVFQLPADSHPRIPYTIGGLLNWTGLELSVSPLAALPPQPTDEQRTNAPHIAPPTDTETALEMPYRLILSPNRNVIWQHSSNPKTHAGRTELWHTRLTHPAPLRAIWSPDYVVSSNLPIPILNQPWPALGKADEWDGQPVLTTINRRDRHELVILTSGFHGFVQQTEHGDLMGFTPTPIQAEQVLLSPLGGWLKSRGSWDKPPVWLWERPGQPSRLDANRQLNISEWVHVATQGRDHYVRIVYEGHLYPFGHRAALIKVTERKFKPVDGQWYAYLAQRMFIVVREPLKVYPNDDRGMPLKQVRLTTLVTPDIEQPLPLAGTDYSFWVKVNGKDLPFNAVGTDSEAHQIDFTAGLIFVPLSDGNKLDAVKAVYDANLNRIACNVPGQPVTYAERDGVLGSDNTTLLTQKLFFATQGGAFAPKLRQASVKLAAVEQLVGNELPVDIRYYADYVRDGGGFDQNNGVFAELIAPAKATFAADKAGGFATPDLSIRYITRKLGAIAGETVANAINDMFDPADFFKAVQDSAKLFGELPLVKLIDLGTFNNAPRIQFFPQANPPEVRLDWQPGIRGVDAGFFRFVPNNATLDIRGVMTKPLDGGEGHSRFEGLLTRFQLEFFKVIRLHFESFGFVSETGKKTAVDVRLLPGEGALEFTGDLKFVNELKKIIPSGLFSDGPSLELIPNPPAIRAGFSIGLPPVAIGVFALKDVSLGASLTLPLLEGRPLFDFNVSERQRPFNLTIAFFGGGGFFHLQLDTKEVRIVEAAFEFGASASVNLGVASGGVHIMAGIYFKLEKKTVDVAGAASRSINTTVLTGYFRMGGELSVLGFISISLEFLLSFTYKASDNGAGKAVGMAVLTVKVEVLFISKSVEIKVEKEFGGEAGDPTFLDTWTDAAMWDEYAGAFA